MTQTHSNLVLIGMPGSGKSTVGVILAKKTSRDFVDTDVLIQTSQKRTLQDIVDTDGYAVLRKIMTRLKSDGILIFLDVDLATLESRVRDFSTRGIARRPDQSFAELFDERFALYTKHADITIKCDGMTQEQVCERLIEEVTVSKANKKMNAAQR